MSVIPATIRPTLDATIGATASGALPWEGGGASGPAGALLDIAQAIFVRSSDGSYRTGVAATPIAFVTSDVLRLESGLYLLEKLSTNVNLNSRDTSAASYSAGTGTGTYDYATGADGTATIADRWVLASAQYSRFRNGGNGRAAASAWRKHTTGTGPHQMVLYGGVGKIGGYVGTATTAWERATVVQTNAAGVANGLTFADGRTLAVNDGTNLVAGAEDVVIDLIQNELGVGYVTSTIICGATAASRQADVMTWLAAEVPLRLREGSSLWTFCPCYPHTGLISGDVRVLGSWGGATDLLRLRHDGTGVKVEALTATTVRAASGYLTFAADATMTVHVNPVSAVLTVAGAATGNGAGAVGTPWAWAGGVGFRLGGEFGGLNEFDGGLGIPVAA